MSHQGSYHVESFASNTAVEIRRLNAQVDLFWSMESELLSKYGLSDGMRVLDCGCGPGRLLELMKRRLPALDCVGVEIDPLLVEAAQRHLAEAGISNCTVQQGSAQAPGLSASSFDFITLRLVLEHVPEPAAALSALSALLKPGGRLVVISNDFDFHLRTSPPVPELDQLYQAYCASRRKDGGDPCIGRRVPRLLLDAGFRLVGAEIELAHSAILDDTPFLKAEGGGIPAQLVNAGFLEASVLDQMTRSWRTMLGEPGHCIARPLWVAVGERPLPGAAMSSGIASAKVAEGDTKVLAELKDIAVGGDTLDTLTAIARVTLERTALSPDDSLSAAGVDSISAMMLQERIRRLTGVEVPIVRFLSDDSLRMLAQSVDRERQLRGHAGAPASTAVDEAAPMEEGEI